MPDQADLQKEILELLERSGSMSRSDVVSRVQAERSEVDEALSALKDRNLLEEDGETGELESVSPVPLSQLAFRGELSPSQAVIRFLYEERGYGQSQIARILDYSPGNVQTNLDRVEEKLGRELEQGGR